MFPATVELGPPYPLNLPERRDEGSSGLADKITRSSGRDVPHSTRRDSPPCASGDVVVMESVVLVVTNLFKPNTPG